MKAIVTQFEIDVQAFDGDKTYYKLNNTGITHNKVNIYFDRKAFIDVKSDFINRLNYILFDKTANRFINERTLKELECDINELLLQMDSEGYLFEGSYNGRDNILFTAIKQSGNDNYIIIGGNEEYEIAKHVFG